MDIGFDLVDEMRAFVAAHEGKKKNGGLISLSLLDGQGSEYITVYRGCHLDQQCQAGESKKPGFVLYDFLVFGTLCAAAGLLLNGAMSATCDKCSENDQHTG